MSLSRAPSARKLTESILKDRERRSQAQTLTRTRARETDNFDPFSVLRWRVVAGGSPGYHAPGQARFPHSLQVLRP
jgi:hypothetical protein